MCRLSSICFYVNGIGSYGFGSYGYTKILLHFQQAELPNKKILMSVC